MNVSLSDCSFRPRDLLIVATDAFSNHLMFCSVSLCCQGDSWKIILSPLVSPNHLSRTFHPFLYSESFNKEKKSPNIIFLCVAGLDVDNRVTEVKDEVFEVTVGMTPDSPASTSPGFCSSTAPKKQEGESFLANNKTKSRIKRSSRRLFLDESLTDEENVVEIDGGPTDARCGDDARSHELGGGGAEGFGPMAAERLAPASGTPNTSWMCPLTFEDVSPGDAEQTPLPSAAEEAAAGAHTCSGVVIKLRRMFSSSLNRKKARYQAVSEPRTPADLPLSQTEADRRTQKFTHRWQRSQSFCRALRPVGRSSKRSFLKVKYCPYLSTCYGAEHQRRWVLRSAVQRARSAHYPDLVGKRIRHLYEEDDKSEVWYRGEVLRVHEAHANPLNTIFEVRYDSEPEWRYYLELLIDYKKGWLKIEG